MPIDVDSTQTLGYSDAVLSDGAMFAGRYMVIDDLGKGGMGHVYRALDTKIDEEVALKFINPEIAADAKIIERFRNELKFTRKITHRNVCRLYDLSEDGDSLFITMEYIQGEDLGNMIRRLGRLPIEKAFPISQQICEGLAEVHRLGVVHRDLKPKNIMIDREGHVKIMDFGLARAPHCIKLTEVGQVVGTPAFMSPEQVNGETLDHRSDIFSLGIIMFLMLTNKLPFEADNTLALALLHKTYRPPNPSVLNPHITRKLGQIILRCLEIDKGSRYQTAQDLLADLKKVGESFDTYAIHLPRNNKAATAAPRSRRPMRKALAVALVVLAVAVSGLGVRSLVMRSGLNARRTRNIHEIDRLITANELSSAYKMAVQFQKEFPTDRSLAALWPRLSSSLSIQTTPSEATVLLKEEREDGGEMAVLGRTPLRDVRIPLGKVRFRIEKEGYITLEDTISGAGGSIDCLLVAKGLDPRDTSRATVDEIIITGDRRSYKIDAGLERGIKTGDRGVIYGRQNQGPGLAAAIVASFRVSESQRGRSSIEIHDQQGDIGLGLTVRFEGALTGVPVTIISAPEEASLLVDGINKGLTGTPVFLSPGSHKLTLVKPGYESIDSTIEVGREPVVRRFSMVPRASPPESQAKSTLVITSEPSFAVVFLGEPPKYAGRTPFEEKVSPGKVRIKVSQEGYKDHDEEIEVSPGKPFSKNFPLLPADGYIEITSVPEGADVFIDSVFTGKTPIMRHALEPGTYEIKVVMKGKKERIETITIQPEQIQKLEYPLGSAQQAAVKYYLRISTEPPDASVILDGILLKEKTPLALDYGKSDAHMIIEKEGFRSLEKDLSLKPLPSRNELPPFKLTPLAKAQLNIGSSDPAQVYLDGKLLGTSPATINAPTFEGTHSVKWLVEGMRPWEETVVLSANEIKTAHFNRDDHPDLLKGGQYELGASTRADIEVDGRRHAAIPPAAVLRSQEGPHEIRYTFRDAAGKTLVLVDIADILGDSITKKVHVAVEATAHKISSDPEFPSSGLEPAKEHGLIIRDPAGTSRNRLPISLDGREVGIPEKEAPSLIRVPSCHPHTFKIDIAKAGDGQDLEILLYCPDIEKRLALKIAIKVH
jgi:serine/threonine protein kinase